MKRVIVAILTFVVPLYGFCLGNTSLPKLMYVPLSGHSKVVLQAYVSTREVSPVWVPYLSLFEELLLLGSQDFSARQLWDQCALAGEVPSVHVRDDFILLQLVMPQDRLELGLAMIESILCRPILKSEQVSEVLTRLKDEQSSPIQALTKKELFKFDIAPEELEMRLRSLHANIFRPENCLLIVGGNVKKEDLQKSLTFRFGHWHEQPKSFTGFDVQPNSASPKSDLIGLELRGAPFQIKDSSSAARVLAVFALGVGKGGSLHRIGRERLGLSYYQQAKLYPTLKGWEPRLQLIRKTSEPTSKWGEDLKQELLKDVNRWDEADLKRALGIVNGIFYYGIDLNPFVLGPTKFSQNDPVHETTWRGHMILTGAEDLPMNKLINLLHAVTLKELKEEATQLLQHSRLVVNFL